jgi:hypothetical protein
MGLEMDRRLAGMMTKIDSYKTEALARGYSRNPNYLMYEGWHHIAVYDSINVGMASELRPGTLTFTSSIAGRISTGEFLYSNAAWNWVDAFGSPWPYRAYASWMQRT